MKNKTIKYKKQKNIGYIIGKLLLENGIDTFFGVPSDLNMPFLDEISKYIKFIPCRNELNASYMAEGYSRSKKFSLLVVGGMVGSFSAINGFANSISENNPIFMIVGGNNSHDDKDDKLSHHTLFKSNHDQCTTYTTFLSLCGKKNTYRFENHYGLINTSSILKQITSSLHHLESVYLEIPVNCQRYMFSCPTIPSFQPSSFEHYQLYNIVKQLLHDKFNSNYEHVKSLKPVFLIGAAHKSYLKYIELADIRFYHLIEEIQGSLFYTMDAKGILDETHKHVIGYYWGGVSEDYKLNYFKESNAIFFIGVHLSDYTSTGYSGMIQPHYTYECKNITTKHVFHHKMNNQYTFNETSRQISSSFTNTITPTTDLFIETGSSWFYGSQIKLPKGTKYHISMNYGSIGWCFPASIGNAFANPERKTLCLTGDGALQCVIQEISTASTYNVNLGMILIHNNKYQVENVLDKEDYNDLPIYDYEKIAISMGCKDVVKCNSSTLEKELSRIMKKKGFSILILKLSEHNIDSLMKNWAELVSKYTVHS